jgi:hypothetical protein
MWRERTTWAAQSHVLRRSSTKARLSMKTNINISKDDFGRAIWCMHRGHEEARLSLFSVAQTSALTFQGHRCEGPCYKWCSYPPHVRLLKLVTRHHPSKSRCSVVQRSYEKAARKGSANGSLGILGPYSTCDPWIVHSRAPTQPRYAPRLPADRQART